MATQTQMTAIQSLASKMQGPVVTPGDPDYDDARALYNAMIDRHPAAIARCHSDADVIASVEFAREQGMEVSVRGGGHNGAGLALADDALVVDLSQMKGIRVDTDARTVRVQAGCLWKEVDHATHPFGLAVPSGIIGTTGVAGLTLGGGHGYLSRQYGLTVDNLLEADVVLANGERVTANHAEHRDLFWAIRGGGGNFGIVTSFLFRAHPVDTVYGGPIIFPIDQSEQIMRWWTDFIRNAPRELSGWLGFHRVPTGSPLPEELHGKHGCVTTWCYTGPQEKAEELFETIRSVGTPVLDMADRMPYPALQGLFDDLYYPPGLQWYWKADFVNELGDDQIEIHKKFGAGLPSELSTMHFYPIDGAVHDVGESETAFSYRDVSWSRVIVGVDEDPGMANTVTEWAREYWQALHPHSAGGGYVNFMMEEGDERIKATYRANYDRLRRIKAKYDPENFFHVNQNIRPAD